MKSFYKSKSILLLIANILVFSFVFIGCNSEKSGKNGKTEEAEATEATLEENAGETEDTFETIVYASAEEYKDAISGLGDSSEDLMRKAEIYEAYSRNYTLNDDEYVEYADICASLGDTKKQRELLWMLYRLNPTKENGDLISQRVYIVDESSKQAEIIRNLKDTVENIGTDGFDIGIVINEFSSSEWIENFYLDTGIYTSHIRYEGEFSVDVYSDQIENKLIMNTNECSYLIESNAIGSKVMKTGLEDLGFEGPFYIAKYDELLNIIEKKTGTISNGHCVNELTISLGDNQYIGHFDDNGHTTEEQLEDTSSVVYAYDNSRNQYLFVSDADINTWTADVEFIGIMENK